MKVLYFDIVGGISGDMTVAALLELGVSLDLLREGIRAVDLPGVEISSAREQRHHISGTRFFVHDAKGGDGPRKDTLHQHGHPQGHEHAHRAYRDIRSMIEESGLTTGSREIALRIFAKLAEAEGAVHDLPPEEVTFHEVGAWDSIADIVCVAVALDSLRPGAVYCSPVPTGSGMVDTAHGRMPVPAPATLLLLQGFPIVQDGPAYERTTPTGASILAALASPAAGSFRYTPLRVGIGIGGKDHSEVPNLLRAVWGEMSDGGTHADTVECAEANLDDANPEWVGYLMERLLEAGALDVSLLPVQMKKNRPGTLVQVLYPPQMRAEMMALLFSETTTLGVRYREMERVVLPRERVVVSTPWGKIGGVAVNFAGYGRFSPEFEECREVARRNGVPLQEVYRAAQKGWQESGKGD